MPHKYAEKETDHTVWGVDFLEGSSQSEASFPAITLTTHLPKGSHSEDAFTSYV